MKFTNNGETVLENDEEYKTMYLDWYNNFLTVGCFADYYGWSDEVAQHMIEQGREVFYSD